jgi:hypothetical protein
LAAEEAAGRPSRRVSFYAERYWLRALVTPASRAAGRSLGGGRLSIPAADGEDCDRTPPKEAAMTPDTSAPGDPEHVSSDVLGAEEGGTDVLGAEAGGTDVLGAEAGGTDVLGAEAGGTDVLGSEAGDTDVLGHGSG